MNQGFFTQEEVNRYKDDSHKTKKLNCFTCKLYKKCKSPKMGYEGKGRQKILIISGQTSKEMDNRNTVYAGQATKFLYHEFKKHSIDIKKDCWKMNAVQCYSEKEPTSVHINCCRKRVFKIIKELEPKVIILLGKITVDSVIGKFFKKDIGSIGKLVNWTIPDRELKAWICPIYHPSRMYKSQNEYVAKLVIRKNIKKIVSIINHPLPKYKDEKDCVEILTDYRDIKKVFQEKNKIVAFDYETTAIKPHAKGHEIVCVSIAVSSDKCYSFMLNRRETKSLKKFLVDENIFKIAQNMKFEHNWSREVLGVEVKGWLWDTMLAQHVLDSRDGITGLKFQAYVYFGIADYDSHINWGKQGSNEMNKIYDIPENELLLYCGIDSLITLKLAMMHMKMFGIIDPLRYTKMIIK